MSAIPAAGLRLQFCADPGEFLAAAGDYLAADPVISTVVTTVAHRLLAQQAHGITQPGRTWWLVVQNASAVAGAAMRTAPFAPYPPFLLPMPGQAAVALARALHERGEEVLGLNGALPAVDLVMQWFGAFMGDADEQAGRPRGASAHEVPDRAQMLRRIRTGRLWFWVTQAGERVHLTGASPPSFGVARVGPVYTPPAQRGRGWASNAVAGISRRIQAEGARVCLFTDQDLPVTRFRRRGSSPSHRSGGSAGPSPARRLR
ncbi:MAG: GNAT family N-acetyltransferase [Streptosporangiales bacterium]